MVRLSLRGVSCEFAYRGGGRRSRRPEIEVACGRGIWRVDGRVDCREGHFDIDAYTDELRSVESSMRSRSASLLMALKRTEVAHTARSFSAITACRTDELPRNGPVASCVSAGRGHHAASPICRIEHAHGRSRHGWNGVVAPLFQDDNGARRRTIRRRRGRCRPRPSRASRRGRRLLPPGHDQCRDVDESRAAYVSWRSWRRS